MLNERFSWSRVRSKGDGVAQWSRRPTCRREGVSWGWLLIHPFCKPCSFPDVYREKNGFFPIFAHKEIIYTWMR